MNLKKNLKLAAVTALLVLLAGLGSLGPASARTLGKWIAGDFHNHTTLTDGSHSMYEDFAYANQFGLDWWANSEHGGAFSRNTNLQYLDTLNPAPVFLGDNAGTDGAHRNMWRWQSLLQYSYPVLDLLRYQYPYTTIIQGLEWNVPGHEHCSSALIANNANAIAQFEYLFDGGDADTTGGKAAPYNFESVKNKGAVKNTTNNHTKAVQAIAWLQKNYRKKSWTVFAHPERKSKYKINDFRDFNNAGPDVAFGFESIPGHQKAANRGEYGLPSSTDGLQTYGGAGVYCAKTGGLWDALLAEGRHWWLFTSSDFHDTPSDFWPGEYCKTWTYVQGRNVNGVYAAQQIADGLRSGNSFCVLGDLINALDFTVRRNNTTATMGQTLSAAKGNVTVTIKFRTPYFNNNGDIPAVDHIDLIAGSVTGKIPPTLKDKTVNPAYSQINSDAAVIKQFTSADWDLDANGWYVISYQVNATKNMFFRLRGTNQNNTTGQIDPASANHDPLADPLGANTEAEAWADLWFYSNPIFVKVH